MDLRDLIKLAGIVNPELLNRIEPTAQATDCGCGVEEDASAAGFDTATTEPEEEIYDDPMTSAGSTVDLSLRRYLKAKGDHVTVDEAVYPDFTVEDVSTAYAAFKEGKYKSDAQRKAVHAAKAEESVQEAEIDEAEVDATDPKSIIRQRTIELARKIGVSMKNVNLDKVYNYIEQRKSLGKGLVAQQPEKIQKLIDYYQNMAYKARPDYSTQAMDEIFDRVVAMVDEVAPMIHATNEAEVEENAFNQAAAAAARANKDSFEFNGKTYKTKMDKATAHKLDDDVDMLRKLAGLV